MAISTAVVNTFAMSLKINSVVAFSEDKKDVEKILQFIRNFVLGGEGGV